MHWVIGSALGIAGCLPLALIAARDGVGTCLRRLTSADFLLLAAGTAAVVAAGLRLLPFPAAILVTWLTVAALFVSPTRLFTLNLIAVLTAVSPWGLAGVAYGNPALDVAVFFAALIALVPGLLVRSVLEHAQANQRRADEGEHYYRELFETIPLPRLP